MSFRGVAQSGRVLALGARCRRFESFRPDQKNNKRPLWVVFYFFPRNADSNLVLIFPSLCLRHNCGAFVTVWSRCARPHLLIVAPTRKQIIFVLILFLLAIKIKHRHRKTTGKICSKNLLKNFLSLLYKACF